MTTERWCPSPPRRPLQPPADPLGQSPQWPPEHAKRPLEEPLEGTNNHLWLNPQQRGTERRIKRIQRPAGSFSIEDPSTPSQPDEITISIITISHIMTRLLDFPLELLDIIMHYAMISRGVARALRLKTVCSKYPRSISALTYRALHTHAPNRGILLLGRPNPLPHKAPRRQRIQRALGSLGIPPAPLRSAQTLARLPRLSMSRQARRVGGMLCGDSRDC